MAFKTFLQAHCMRYSLYLLAMSVTGLEYVDNHKQFPFQNIAYNYVRRFAAVRDDVSLVRIFG